MRSPPFPAIGRALAAVADGHLYRLAGYPSFARYVEQEWRISSAYAYRQIDAAKVVHELEVIGVDRLPTNEAQARELRRVGGTAAQMAAILAALPTNKPITAASIRAYQTTVAS